jgi:hypothetical protein
MLGLESLHVCPRGTGLTSSTLRPGSVFVCQMRGMIICPVVLPAGVTSVADERRQDALSVKYHFVEHHSDHGELLAGTSTTTMIRFETRFQFGSITFSSS